MQRPSTASFLIGDWRFDPASGELARYAVSIRLDVRAARLLACLAERAGETVSADELLNRVWTGVTVSQDSVYQAVASLRRQLGDDAKVPQYIETVPRLGYRMVATVRPLPGGSPAQKDVVAQRSNPAMAGEGGNAAGDRGKSVPRRRARRVWAAAAAGCLAFVLAAWAMLAHQPVKSDLTGAAAVAPPPNSIAVLPFLDLTEGMKNEEFADGITEELIDKISKIPALHVASPTSSFYFKGKQVPVAEIAKSLSVAYVLDGSLRKSGTWVRVDARLVRAENGYVAWSATYDQPMSDILTIQDDIAKKVTGALQGSIGSGARKNGSR
ncbi:MAG TPA: winged helix-turn-helix domain-containing protein [Terracidiphilus sp.]|nr:winged helix-turn-helix domain-containing protein [Terracidiphilus sp.]